MDPLSQGLLGATAAQNISKKETVVVASLLGFLGGMAPDLDIIIRSETDPLLFLEFHRQFTHSLLFIPIGGLLCGVVLYYLLAKWRGLSLKQSVLFCSAGYATHALLDACTSYGTLLLWPFSDQRFAWNNISIIDPLYTLPILVLVLGAWLGKKTLARYALIWMIAYPLIGVLQRERAEAIGEQLAKTRGHDAIDLKAKPSFANLLVWKIIYEAEGQYFVDAVRVAFNTRIYEGGSIQKLDIDKQFPWLDKSSQQAKDIERFRWFSNGYIAKDPLHLTRIVDMRYSLVPNQLNGLWYIELSPLAKAKQHARYEDAHDTNRGKALGTLIDMLFGRDI